jgi:hypothetical protein
MDPVKDKTESKGIDFHERCVFAYALIMNARNTLHHAQSVLYSHQEKLYGTEINLRLTQAHNEVYALEQKMARFIWPCPTTWSPKEETK